MVHVMYWNASHADNFDVFSSRKSPPQICDFFDFRTAELAVTFSNAVSKLKGQSSNISPPKNGLIALWPSTNGAIPYFLVLPGSELSITEITEHTYFSPLKPSREFIYKSE